SDKLMLTYVGTTFEFLPLPVAVIYDWLGACTTNSRPTVYAFTDGQLSFYPTPDATYTVTAYGIFDLAALDQDSDESSWTDQAEDLIAYD
ncbi:phage adaptor protein, partial [Corynebacterium diphtheriae]|uniref:phage adaptor protein n=1 Tax=Corynebacterium diphtheriae TaxID=1717 RepID=UPI000D430D0D